MRLISYLPFLGLISALYQDQVGKVDWKLDVLGFPKLAAFDDANAHADAIAVYTEQNILASVSAEDGSVFWKRTMPVSEKVEYVYYANKLIISISSGGIARYWNPESGALFKEVYTTKKSQLTDCARLYSKSIVFCAMADENGGSDILVYRERKALFETKSSISVEKIVTNEENNLIYLIGKNAQNAFVIEALNIDDFSTEPVQILSEESITLEEFALVSDGRVVFTDFKAKTRSINLKEGTMADISAAASCKVIGHSQKEIRFAPDQFYGNCGGIVRSESGEVQDGSRMEIFPTRLGTVTASLDVQNRWIFTGTNAKKTASLTFGGNVVKSLWTKSYNWKNKEHIQVLAFSQDGTLFFAKASSAASTVAWTREESLAAISQVHIFDLPPEDALLEDPSEWSFTRRVQIQLALFHSYINQITDKLKSGSLFEKKNGDPLVSTSELIRDQFNLHKLIFIATKNGNLFGIDSLSKDIIWKRSVPELNECKTQILKDAGPRFKSNIYLVGNCNNQVKYFNVDIMSGAVDELNSELPKTDILRVDSIRSSTSSGTPALLVFKKIDVGKVGVEIVGEIDEATTEKIQRTAFWLYDSSSQAIYGGKIDIGSKTFENTWTFQIPASMKASQVTAAPASDVLHSQGRPLADRSVMEKYLNPNMIAVLAESKEQSDLEQMYVNAFFLDGITGEVIHSCSHKRAQGPANIVLAENWAVFSYWSAKMYRTEVTSIEFYKGNDGGNATHWDSLSAEMPVAIQKSFISSEEITSLAVTQSQMGITNKAVLIGTKSGKIVSLPRVFLDPRRRLVPASTDREEGIMPYQPELRFPPNFVLSYYQNLGPVNDVKVAITGLESTCTILGLTDTGLFWTRVHPSGTFDVLKDDFDHMMITVILIGFVGATYACKIFAQMKMTNRLWQ